MRQRILIAAARLFRERGFHATTARAIAEIVGMLSGSLFHHFRSKEQMLFEVMNDAAIGLCERAETAVAAAADPRARLNALVRVQLECLVGEDSRDYYAVLINEWRHLDSGARRKLKAHRIQYSAIWQAVLEDCARLGLLRADAQVTQFALHGAINWATTWFKPSGRLSLEEYATLLENLVLERAPSAC